MKVYLDLVELSEKKMAKKNDKNKHRDYRKNNFNRLDDILKLKR